MLIEIVIYQWHYCHKYLNLKSITLIYTAVILKTLYKWYNAFRDGLPGAWAGFRLETPAGGGRAPRRRWPCREPGSGSSSWGSRWGPPAPGTRPGPTPPAPGTIPQSTQFSYRVDRDSLTHVVSFEVGWKLNVREHLCEPSLDLDRYYAGHTRHTLVHTSQASFLSTPSPSYSFVLYLLLSMESSFQFSYSLII